MLSTISLIGTYAVLCIMGSYSSETQKMGENILEVFHRQLREKNVKHKDLFPLDQRDIWGTILVGLGTMIAASG